MMRRLRRFLQLTGEAADARALTDGEWAELSEGLGEALKSAGAAPRIAPRPHPAAWLAASWMGSAPIMAIGRTIWWPGARPSFAGSPDMAILQHELQHLLDYAEGALSIGRYLMFPSNWRYGYRLSADTQWRRLGAEQRASVAEDLWRSERAADDERARLLRKLTPWARPRA